MANIRLDLQVPIENGQSVTFKSPTNCSSVTGLKVYYPQGSATVSKTFQFADAHGNNIGGKNLFASNVFVKVILDTSLSRAYVQNADTNAYLESMFAGDQKPVYTASSTLTALKSGEKLSVAFGKISKAISDLISHLSNKQNPHEVTADQIGASKSEHTHKYAGSSTEGGSATSAEKLATGRYIITDLSKTSRVEFDGTGDVFPGVTGTLPITKGGTGATTSEKARENLGIITADEIANLHIWKKYTDNPLGYKLSSKSNVDISFLSGSGHVIYYSDKVEKDTEVNSEYSSGFKLVDPIQLKLSSVEDCEVLRGKFTKSVGNSGTFPTYLIPEDCVFTFDDGAYASTASQLVKVTSEFVSYVTSKTNNTYPTSGKHSDTYWYEYHKQLGE